MSYFALGGWVAWEAQSKFSGQNVIRIGKIHHVVPAGESPRKKLKEFLDKGYSGSMYGKILQEPAYLVVVMKKKNDPNPPRIYWVEHSKCVAHELKDEEQPASL